MKFSDYFSRLPLRRRRLLQSAVAATGGTAALGTFLAACSNASTGNTPSANTEGLFPSHPKWNFVFVNHVTTNAFFTPTKYGAEDACALLGCSYSWTGSATSVVSEMVQSMNSAIASKADGIAVAIISDSAFNGPTQDALTAGIPVVSYNADSTTNKRLAYIGQGLYQSGFEVGTRLAQQVTSGTVVGFIATPGTGNIQPRMDGAVAAFKQLAPAVNVVQVASGATIDLELPAIETYVSSHPDVKGYFAVDGGSTSSLGQAIAKYNLASKVASGGYDLEPLSLQAVQQGNLGFTIDQQPYLQGFIPVLQLFLYKLSGGLMQPSETDTGLLFVTKDTVGKYQTTQSRFEGSSSAEKVIS
jgi:simple sugar transport system substrate-binding protein